MKRFLAFIGGLAAAFAIAYLLLPVIVPTQTVREAVAERISAWTGEKVVFAGPVELKIFPSLHIRIEDVALAPPEGDKGEPLLAMEELSGELQLLPLVMGNIEIDEFRLVRPRLNLNIDHSGETNWPAAPASSETSREQPAARPPEAARGLPVSSLRVGRFSIVDGQVLFNDAATSRKAELTGINAEMNWPALDQAIRGAGSLIWNGEVVRFEGSAGKPLELANGGEASDVSLRVESGRLNMTANGIASTSVDLAFDGNIELASPSIRALARWVGVELPDGPGLDNFSLRSKFIAGGTKLSFSEAALSLDGNAADGALILKIDNARPTIQATLAFSTLNLNPYLPQPAAKAQDEEAERSEGWSETPIDFSGLRGTDADLRLSAQKIVARDYDLGGGAVTISLKDGQLKANLPELAAYGGRISARLSLDAAGEALNAALSLSGQDVALKPFLADTIGFERLSGTGKVDIDIGSKGAHRAAMIASLNGKGSIQAGDGQLDGADLSAILKGLQEGKIAGWGGSGDATTVFESFSAGFTLADGAARTDDLLLKSPNLRVAGVGTVDIVQRQVDFKLDGALLRAGSGSTETPEVIMQLPLIIRGPWQKPRIYPDAAGLLNQMPGAKETIEGVEKALEKGDLKGVGDALKKGGLNSVLDRLRGN